MAEMEQKIRRMISQMLAPLRTRIFMVVSRAVLEAVKDTDGIQTNKLCLLAEEIRDGLERFQNYGFTSHPKVGAEAVAVFPGGDREHGIIIAVDDRRFRLTELVEGEVAMYTDEAGHKIVLKRGGKFEIANATHNKVQVENDLIKALRDGFVQTTLGPQQILHPPDTIAAIKARHNTFVP